MITLKRDQWGLWKMEARVKIPYYLSREEIPKGEQAVNSPHFTARCDAVPPQWTSTIESPVGNYLMSVEGLHLCGCNEVQLVAEVDAPTEGFKKWATAAGWGVLEESKWVTTYLVETIKVPK